jgi:hypothetical protein
MHWKRLLCICWWCRCSPASIYLLAFIRAVVQKKAWIRWTMETRQSITMTWIASYLQMCGLDNTIIKVFIMSRLVLWSHILRRTIVFRMLADYRHLLWIGVDRFRQPSFNHYSVRQLERNQPLPRVHWLQASSNHPTSQDTTRSFLHDHHVHSKLVCLWALDTP